MSTPSDEPNQLSRSCVGASSSKVLVETENGEDLQLLCGSMSDSDIPIATHFSPINFDDWTPYFFELRVVCTEVNCSLVSVDTPALGSVVDKGSEEHTDLVTNLYGFPTNSPKKQGNEPKKKWFLRNLPQDVLDDVVFWEKFPPPDGFVPSDPRKENPPKTSLKGLQVPFADEDISKTSD